MIHEFLETGAENAITGRDLATMTGLNQRAIQHTVERERRAGWPICASCNGEHPGYFMAANKAELEQFCRSLFHRAGEVHKTRKALMATMATLPD